ncbi:glutamyl-tRNA synthetase [Nonlabens sp. YIK11]|uniref:DUF4175 family protein n=1 Tax=Nonlabens sp. YIK11 TaxID=1453349 RepID=UPI0006DD2038|nr:DUF4175 family protein [Nonlabens sp. YIK11]KQC32371.1 glutamyl-tRNA synthetase [Nonlabens sp. YIK11]
MTNFQIIEQKLNRFIRKYYVNELIRGVILFLAIGLLYFITVAVVEYFFWLNKLGRTILFWSFILVELGLLFKFVAIPIARLVKLFSGIDFRDASEMIGNHFPEVSDKLVNVLQLHANGGDDELTWASINQKSEDLKPIPFSLAIDFNNNKQYLKYLAVPIIIIGALIATGNNDVITSASRVADYKTDYIPPAPFRFEVTNENLDALENAPFILNVKVAGTRLPENASIVVDGQSFYLNQQDLETYSFTFERPTSNTSFYLMANELRSTDYVLNVDKVPTIQGFELQMDYPSYTGKKDEILKSTGNALVPQGTNIIWRVNTTATDLVQFRTADKNSNFENEAGGLFAFAKAISQPLSYSIVTSNNKVRDHEQLDFKIEVVADEYPELSMEMKRDSLDDRIMYFKGQAADDYGIRFLQLVYYKNNEANDKKVIALPNSGGTYQQFVQSFPGNLALEPGNTYNFYFEVIDNDAVNRFKSTKSEVYSFNKATMDQEEDLQLQEQKESLSNLEKALKEQQKEQDVIKELSQDQIEKDDRSFNDKRKLDQAVKNQQKKEQDIQKQLNRLENQLDKTAPKDDPKKAKLQERLQETAAESKKNEELLKQIEEYQDKLSKEELQEQLEKSQKKTREQQRSLKQLLELTKRYYVAQKYEQLGRKLMEMAERQEEQSKKDAAGNTKQDQDKLNQEYEQWEKELRELEKENNDLQKPMDLEFDPQESDDIKSDQKDASESLKNKNAQQAKPKQKSAADKMKKQAAAMEQDMNSMEGEQMEEDLEMLRQILDNLVLFSQSQETVLEDVKSLKSNSPRLGKSLRSQKELELAFKHVDDSLFTLSSRNADLGKEINEEVVDIYYYMDKSMEQLAEFDLNQGQVSQQFTLGSANTLAVLLSDVLDSANNPNIGPGKPGKSGQGAGFQLPDLIRQQESLQKEGEEGKEGNKGKEGQQGKERKQGNKGEQGNKPGQGKAGESGQEGQSGKAGQQGSSGTTGTNGKSGEGSTSEGKSGESKGKGREGQNGTGAKGDGKEGDGKGSGNGSNDGDEEENSYRESEEESQRIYEIYKQQQDLRNQLEDMIIHEGLQKKVDEITGAMKGVERKLLDQGFNREVQQQMSEIIHDLLKLKDANAEQGEENQRQSQTNFNQFENPLKLDEELIQRYFNNKEILNRQVLPLQPHYRSKVKEYFKTDD